MNPRSWIFLFLAAVPLFLASCAEMAKEMGEEKPADLEMRSGPVGTPANPVTLDAFKKYPLVLAGEDCRYFMLKVPSQWYWKVFLTVDNRDFERQGRLTADFARPQPPWAKLPNVDMAKIFILHREGVQGVVGVGNKDEPRYALLRLCQEGAPLKVTLQSEVFSGDFLGPGKKPRK